MHANSLAVTLQRRCEYVHQMGDIRPICTQHSFVCMTVLSEMGSAESLLAYFCIWRNRRKQITCSWDKAIWNINKWKIESPLFWDKAPQPRRGDCICITTSLITHKRRNLKQYNWQDLRVESQQHKPSLAQFRTQLYVQLIHTDDNKVPLKEF